MEEKQYHESAVSATRKLQSTIARLKMITYASLIIAVIAIGLAAMPIYNAYVKGQQPNFGHTLAGINVPLTPSQLAIINNASNANFETAGEMFLNQSLKNIAVPVSTTNALIVNGKVSVIYLGATSCIYCGENRWAMALALGKFGKFSSLYKGYSALQDGDVPTLYWTPATYNASSGVTWGSNYTSSYISFLPIEYQSPISAGFQIQSLPYFQQQAQASGMQQYVLATNMIANLNTFQGTPYTIWGRSVVPGVDSVAFANDTTSLANMTHAQVLNQIAHPNNQFAWTQYLGADLYIAMTCSSINNAAPICSLPAIKGIQKANGY